MSTLPDLAAENAELRARLAEAQETIDAIRSGAVDALVTSGPAGEQVFTLQGAETPYRLLMESMNEGAATLAPDGTVLYCNQRLAEMASLPAEQIVGSCMWECVLPEQRPVLRELIAEARSTGSKAEFTFSCAAGQGLPVLLSLSPIGTDSGAVGVVATDLSERKANEEKLRQLNQELEATVRHRNAELQAIFDTAPIGLAIAEDPEGRHIRGNPAIEQTLGVERGGELSRGAAQPPAYRCLQEGRELSAEELPMQRAARGETIAGHVLDILRPGGKTVTLYSNAVPLLDEQGRPRGAVGAFLDITERIRTEGALRESERRLRRAQQIANVGSWEWNIRTGAVTWSEQMYRQTGQPLDFTPTHETFRQLLHPDDRAAFEAAIQGALSGSAPYDIECRIVHPDGTVRVLHTRGELLRGPDGQPQAMAGASLDITERKHAEDQRRLSEEKFSRAFANNPAAIALTRLQDGVVLDVNDTWLMLTGYTREEVMGRSIRAMKAWPRAEDVQRFVAELKAQGSLHGWEQEFYKKSGELYVAQLAAQLLDVQGEQIVLSTLLDITERKQAERAIFASNQRLQALMQALPVGVSFSDDATCRRIAGNPAVLAQFEITAADNLFASAPDDTAPGRQVRFFRDGQPITGADLPLERAVAENREITDIEFEVLLPSGRRWYAQGSGAPIRDQQGRVVGGVAVTVDITALKHTEAALRSKEAELRAITEVTPVMLSRCSRDLRYLYANRAYASMLDTTPEQIIGKPIVEIMGERGFATIRPRVEQVLAGQPAEYQDQVHFTLTGKSRWLHAAYMPDRDAHGQVVGWIASIADITEQKQAEEALRRIEEERKVAEAVHVERQRFRDVLNMLPAYVVLLSPDYRVPFANRFFEERFGKAEDPHFYKHLFNRQETRKACESFKVLQTHAPHRWEWTGPDGRHYDISERKQAEAELTRHREHLQELVHERTAKLHETNEELLRFNRAMVGRELRMIELKQEINALCAALGRPPIYEITAKELQP